jgi:hypothetical protein
MLRCGTCDVTTDIIKKFHLLRFPRHESKPAQARILNRQKTHEDWLLTIAHQCEVRIKARIIRIRHGM